MAKGFFSVPKAVNEPIKSYAPGTPERAELQAKIEEMSSQKIDIPMYIGSQEVRTDNLGTCVSPHDHQNVVGEYHKGDKDHVTQAINAALGAREAWAELSWEHRASIFLKAADLLAGPYRAKINAATVIGQSKTAHQAEIDSACELIDFLRFNVQFMTEIYQDQPESAPGMWNRLEYRPLEGFIFALTPFNFTAIAGNLPTAPAMMGNTIVWKPSHDQIYSANVLMEVFKEAGVPDGVINLVYVSGPDAGDVIFNHPEFAGLHFTGSTGVFQDLWATIGNNIAKYNTYPRIVGETGGKDFILAHKSATPKGLATAITRGAFEFQGQKCSAASRVYVPNNMWDEVKGYIIDDANDIKNNHMGTPHDFKNFFTAVINEKSFDKCAGYIDRANASDMCEIIAGGGYDKSKGYFVEPTIIVTKDPNYESMVEEIFGPIVTIYVYDAEYFDEAMYLVNNTSTYALTGAIFAQDRYAIELATSKLSNAAGNFYINDKPTGAVVGQQPFGGSRASGTNDKAGSAINLMRWTTPRTLKETFVPPTDYKYPFMG
ncbi:L-glutamate gamma-semialdehyde dehydrogenase [Flammeovirga yaeyamensis]|uniref:L-glutamate gamma-semialdehyde dehydrogenase n=1 Tax=Flammeovirga yaeyamensis TaxID=367791 RepID=A0AAX1N8U8_9BACT|nr:MULTISPECIES: L-glutamate gamma-semialdehyde dehydrogenase [Flammeovirga]ANQ50203.1 L-glutamate gamma-semialdehyde dehydrogenase [Flammeovirga sp. MY04]MBB3699837.1 1-pyrroline-5-carboxylate dehydrogenase [Flammeovirga yaeyamensis]NMF36594.1 L-glutamate gamma-semialdehyde dehydrogenase [Flammeovirga yaeyamensis]QWG02358.1 L-glutamate gamma-semialdehyde dehydrogenase [Flammeovirga yaeyamensis]